MRLRSSLVLVVTAMMALAGCAKTIRVRVTLDPAGNPVFDKAFHDSAVVEPGDRITWVCQCPPGTEFSVTEPHFVVDLEHVLEAVQEMEPAERAPAESEISRDTATAVLTKLRSGLAAHGQRNLFARGQWDLDDSKSAFKSGKARIPGPGRVAPGIGNSLWKFTWRVRLKGSSDVVEWDPHIVGHEKEY